MYSYKTRGTCSQEILFDVDGDTIKEVHFVGGCMGNTTGISRLVAGMKVQDAIDKLKGIDCGGKGTSCPDQLSIALSKYLETVNK